jgi:hypothetical protein
MAPFKRPNDHSAVRHGDYVMPLSAEHWLLRAEEARILATQCDDPALRRMMQDIASDYRDLAASRYRAVRRELAQSAPTAQVSVNLVI